MAKAPGFVVAAGGMPQQLKAHGALVDNPDMGGLQWPMIPAPGHLMLSSGRWEHLYPCVHMAFPTLSKIISLKRNARQVFDLALRLLCMTVRAPPSGVL